MKMDMVDLREEWNLSLVGMILLFIFTIFGGNGELTYLTAIVHYHI